MELIANAPRDFGGMNLTINQAMGISKVAQVEFRFVVSSSIAFSRQLNHLNGNRVE